MFGITPFGVIPFAIDAEEVPTYWTPNSALLTFSLDAPMVEGISVVFTPLVVRETFMSPGDAYVRAAMTIREAMIAPGEAYVRAALTVRESMVAVITPAILGVTVREVLMAGVSDTDDGFVSIIW